MRELSPDDYVAGFALARIGANVSATDAEKWGDILFKRFWLSGVTANFFNIDWRSDIGSAVNYHENASNAFAVASQIADKIKAIPGEKVVNDGMCVRLKIVRTKTKN